jgi:hypothetical protein
VTLRRGYFTCRRCGTHAHPLDDRLGVAGLVSPHAQRLLCVAGAERSFERAARLLRELAGLNVCDNTVHAACDRHGGQMRAWRRDDPEASRPFREAQGDVEFQTDGTCVNTTGGWREVRLSIFAKRRRGEPVLASEDWDDQRMPTPHVRFATATIGSSETLGPQWRRTAQRLKIGRTDDVTVLADGAKWIWNEAERNLPGAVGVLDVFHALEHLHATAVALQGAGPAAEAWFQERRRTLLRLGMSALMTELTAEPRGTEELTAYLWPHVDRTPYRLRLAEGRSIGSGMVEGACKTAVGQRLKQTGARWRVKRLERMAALCCLWYSDLFDAYWKVAAG